MFDARELSGEKWRFAEKERQYMQAAAWECTADNKNRNSRQVLSKRHAGSDKRDNEER